MYSFIFFSKACPFLHNRLIISQNTEFTIQSHLKPQKLFMWLTELSVARYTLFLWIIKKGNSVNTSSGLGWTEALGNVIYKQEVGVQRGGKRRGYWRPQHGVMTVLPFSCGMVPSGQKSNSLYGPQIPECLVSERVSTLRVKTLKGEGGKSCGKERGAVLMSCGQHGVHFSQQQIKFKCSVSGPAGKLNRAGRIQTYQPTNPPSPFFTLWEQIKHVCVCVCVCL